MIWKNPFLLRQTEKIDSEIDFLRLFSADALNFVTEDSFNKVQFIRSSPGAGKTTVFKAIQPNMLNTLHRSMNDPDLKEYYKFVKEKRIIEKGQVKLLSCLISCAKSYDIIDEIFQNGRRQQVLFALLNIRITILALKSIMSILSLQKIDDLKNVTFRALPEDFGPLENLISNGYDLYSWARKEEKKVCDYIDSLSNEKTDFSLYYNGFLVLKLFEPKNVLYNNEEFLYYTLIIFDDMQKLTGNQRKAIISCLYTMRPTLGVWIGERLEALSSEEIISTDANIGREFEVVELEEYWRDTHKETAYKKVLTNIADRRVKLKYADTIGNFANCIDASADYSKYESRLNGFVKETFESIKKDVLLGNQYKALIKAKINQNDSPYEQAVTAQLIKIKFRRELRGQTRFELNEHEIIEEFDSFSNDSGNRSAAEFYLSLACGLPYYFGAGRIKSLSSYNIEQFLSFAGVIFEKSIAKKIIKIGENGSHTIKAEDQEKYLKEAAEKRWLDILNRYNNGQTMQTFLKNLCTMSQKIRDSGTNPYSGGSITGIAIAVNDISELKERYPLLFAVICDCIASNYFEKRIMPHGGKSWLVLYFNRWICLKFDLPLKYGGWKKMKLEKLNEALERTYSFSYNYPDDTDDIIMEQITFNGYEAV